jgi:hypothetical protein
VQTGTPFAQFLSNLGVPTEISSNSIEIQTLEASLFLAQSPF